MLTETELFNKILNPFNKYNTGRNELFSLPVFFSHENLVGLRVININRINYFQHISTNGIRRHF